MAVLVLEKGQQEIARFEVVDDTVPTIIGRDAKTDVVLDDERASRQHGRIFRRSGRWVIEDLGSRNGILYRGKATRRAVISSGERFRIGSTYLRLEEGEYVDQLAGKEFQGTRLMHILGEEAGVLSYLGQQLAMDRRVRIDIVHPRRPVVPPEVATAGERNQPPGDLLERLQQAIEATRKIQHSLVIPLLRAQVQNKKGSDFVMLRHWEGNTLESVLSDFFELPTASRVQFFYKLAEGVLTRSVEPLCYPLGLRHITIRDTWEQPVVASLELSAFLAFYRGQTIDLPAFPAYLPPEVVSRGANPSRPLVVYNLGAIGYHLLTGTPPMGEGDVKKTLDCHQNLSPASARLLSPDLSEGLADLLSRMLEKDPGARPESTEEILKSISRELDAAPTDAAATMAPPPRGPVPALTRPATGRATPRKRAASPRRRQTARPPLELAQQRGVPIWVQLFFWPALWAGLFIASRFLTLKILERSLL